MHNLSRGNYAVQNVQNGRLSMRNYKAMHKFSRGNSALFKAANTFVFFFPYENSEKEKIINVL